MLLVTFTLLRPGFFWDQWYPELIERPATELVSILDEMEPNSHVRLQVKGEKFDGNEVTKTVMLSIGDEPTGEDRLRGLGLTTTEEGENLRVGMVMFGSPADRALIRFGYEITSVHVENERPSETIDVYPGLAVAGADLVFPAATGTTPGRYRPRPETVRNAISIFTAPLNTR